MASQTDLDMGGTYRQYQRVYLGPSVGWVTFPVDNVLAITAAGVYSPVNGTTLITLNVAGLVTVNLWNPTQPTIPAGALPGPYMGLPLTIVDIGSHCATFNATINPSVGKTIMGLASIAIANDYGGFILRPNLANGNWDQQP